MYHIVTMPSRLHAPLCQRAATLLSVAQPLVAVSQNPLRHHAANQHPDPIFRDLLLGASQVLAGSKPENEPEQSIEKQSLTEAQKPSLSNSLKTKDRVSSRFFCCKRT
jgi:hypothetical protein